MLDFLSFHPSPKPPFPTWTRHADSFLPLFGFPYCPALCWPRLQVPNVCTVFYPSQIYRIYLFRKNFDSGFGYVDFPPPPPLPFGFTCFSATPMNPICRQDCQLANFSHLEPSGLCLVDFPCWFFAEVVPRSSLRHSPSLPLFSLVFLLFFRSIPRCATFLAQGICRTVSSRFRTSLPSTFCFLVVDERCPPFFFFVDARSLSSISFSGPTLSFLCSNFKRQLLQTLRLFGPPLSLSLHCNFSLPRLIVLVPLSLSCPPFWIPHHVCHWYLFLCLYGGIFLC